MVLVVLHYSLNEGRILKLYLSFDETYLVIYDLFQAEYLACNSILSYNIEL